MFLIKICIFAHCHIVQAQYTKHAGTHFNIKCDFRLSIYIHSCWSIYKLIAAIQDHNVILLWTVNVMEWLSGIQRIVKSNFWSNQSCIISSTHGNWEKFQLGLPEACLYTFNWLLHSPWQWKLEQVLEINYLVSEYRQYNIKYIESWKL